MNKLKILTATDLHCIESLYQELTAAVELHRPDIVALVGDFLDVAGSQHKQLSNAESARQLSQLRCRDILFTRGNHEDVNWWEFAESWAATGRDMKALHGEAFVTGPLVVIGFPCAMGDETAFVGVREYLPSAPEEWLSPLLKQYGPGMRAVWLMHEPPTGTRLSQKGTVVSGNPDWNSAIERFSPWLTISGHDHVTPLKSKCWHHRIGQTVCVNAGQSDSGPLHYCLVEAEFAGTTVSLPAKLKVTAYPWEQSLTLPEQGGALLISAESRRETVKTEHEKSI